MCGIIGCVSKKRAIPVLINGLKNLEYRGYDSAGIAYIKDNKIKTIKSVGRISNLEEKVNLNENTFIGIGHTRWATHGKPNLVNSHPHSVGDITLVHNGIIENYEELKKELKSYSFKSDTDTEVACAVIDSLYNKSKDIIQALNEASKMFVGSYALGILVKGSNNLYCLKKDSPLVIGVSDTANFIASDVRAFLEHTNKYVDLEDNEIGVINKEVTVYDKLKEKQFIVRTYNHDFNIIDKGKYDHFMLKEIHEESIVIKNLINDKKLSNQLKTINLKQYSSIDIVACGSAYHAGLVGKNLIEKYLSVFVNVEIASEYRYKKILNKNNKLVIFISQSGETADTLACLKLVKKLHIKSLAIVNVVGSSIAKEADEVLYTNAGIEVAVATTKAYLAQIFMLMLLVKFNAKLSIKKELDELPNLIKKTVDFDYKNIADAIYQKEDIFFIGRQIDFAISMEGSLKLKEISYIHSEAYPSGELKHGTISLINDGSIVFGVLTDKSVIDKEVSNLKEVMARGANIFTIGNENILNIQNHITTFKTHDLLSPILTIIPLQLIAYEVAKKRGCDIDKPKNLAKSVTVE